MKRSELLKVTLSEEKNVNTVLENTTKADGKFLNSDDEVIYGLSAELKITEKENI